MRLGVLAGAQQFGELVDQRHVGRGQLGARGALHEGPIGCVELGGQALQQCRARPQPLQKPDRRGGHPAQVDLPTGVAGGADVLANPSARVGIRGVPVGRGGELVGQALQQPQHEGLAREVVGLARPAGPADRLAHILGTQLKARALHDDGTRRVGYALQVPHCSAQDRGPHLPRLHLGHGRWLYAAGVHAGNQVRQCGGYHATLAQ